MYFVSDVKQTEPPVFNTPLQQMVYEMFRERGVRYERVDTDPAITMEDCIRIDQRLNMKTVKTLFLCNRQQTNFYLVITTAGKPFKTKDLGAALGISRLSFASVELLRSILGTDIGAATVFGLMLDRTMKVQLVIDNDILSEEWYGCSDGTTTSYLKLSTAWVINEFIPSTGHTPQFVQL
ncbi:prolyl-tRNA synthetase associated domain-containing protein [Chitinophaga ginsengisegetis]|uniref:prolyl-tRNA synthetase associated domain-containing protein n=1 Tax=Chitinophaga ginsengisegetis TaxID=393003 RepID=UPI000DB98FEB|nr:prolyl-tRNA synthetase associated domain-containing protein [Chitinophaga ginsengisegetis]MDR6568191.1 Ala-tRNA(Pro) deacylase [Chitinophaga ginsengisegetis]MDR6647254.1 Ala-tRNA(Pro) deacylase [Chitinophaga ginsengisegetis]MDR6653603.1 Ala-tRNA(Pro) deacylase [Chitinophaga ginsengisegetis]